jgi:hypothetical protein
VIDRVSVTRYVTPLREGGSLPGIVEADDFGTYVCKFRGAGQGVRVLVAEVLVAALATRLGLDTPRQVALDLSGELARYEADEEVQDLLRASLGLNLGVDFLPGAFGWEPRHAADQPEQNARILWLDALVANVDRSWRNPNLLRWHGRTWLIDHGAALYFHHGWPASGAEPDPARWADQPWDPRDHVFAGSARLARELDQEFRGLLDRDCLRAAVALVPDEWLAHPELSAARLRDRYLGFLEARLGSSAWLPGEGSR